jgi:hypothetical protein
VQYVHLVTRLTSLARKYWFDLLIAIAVLECALEACLGTTRCARRDHQHGSPCPRLRGHGLFGIGERVKLYGGEMRTGTAADGGFVLATRLLPLTNDRQ